MKKMFLFVAACAAGFLATAQSYHLSQFYSTPLLVNPAFTGSTGGPYRFAANYRSQWRNEGTPYTTFTASGDAHILKNVLSENSVLEPLADNGRREDASDNKRDAGAHKARRKDTTAATNARLAQLDDLMKELICV